MLSCLSAAVDVVAAGLGIRMIPSVVDLEPESDETVLDVPSYSQVDGYSCGATAGWAIVETFHPRADRDQFYRTTNPKSGEGVGPGPIVRALRLFGVGVSVRKRLKWKDVVRIIDDEYPMIVGTGNNLFPEEGDHWNTLYGYGVRPRKVFLGNQIGVFRNQTRVCWEEFDRQWWNTRREAMVCWGK